MIRKIAFLTTATGLLLVAGSMVVDSTGLMTIKTAISALEESKGMQHASWSFYLADASSGETIYSYDKDRSLVPASVMKLYTTGLALQKIGKDHRFKTQLAIRGVMGDSGVWHGDVIILGGGDPTLGSQKVKSSLSRYEVLDKWTEALRANGIRAVDGNIIGNGSYYRDRGVPGVWTLEDMGNYYGAPANGLTFADNEYDLYLSSGARGTPTTVTRTEPKLDSLVIINEVLANGNYDNAYIWGEPFNWKRTIKGSVPPNHSTFIIRGSVPDPAYFAAAYLKEFLEKANIPVYGTARSNYQPEAQGSRVISTLLSPALIEIIEHTNEKSNNLYAEHLLKEIGKEIKGVGSTDNGIAVLQDYLNMLDIGNAGTTFCDGSGLSRKNLTTGSHLGQWLYYMNKSAVGDDFKHTLSIAGETGTLRGVCAGKDCAGKVRGKSGTITGVRTYAGFITDANGKELIFVMLGNNFSWSSAAMRNQWEKLMELIARSSF